MVAIERVKVRITIVEVAGVVMQLAVIEDCRVLATECAIEG